MDQALYILNNDFFDKESELDFEDIADRIEDLTKTERIILVYDPFCGETFQRLTNDLKEQELRELMLKYYGALEKCDKHQFEWYQLNEFLDYHIEILNEIMITVDFMTYSISSIGCLPFEISDKKMFLFYHINPYFEVDNKFYLIGENQYLRAIDDLLKDYEKV